MELALERSALGLTGGNLLVATFVEELPGVGAADRGASVRRAGTSPDARFAGSEYYSSWWTLCAALPNVVNRPGPWAWLHEREARARLAPQLVPEYWTSTPAELAAQWENANSAEIHLEDLVGFGGHAFLQPNDLAEWVASGSHSEHMRAIFAPSSSYLLQICVGGEPVTVLNEIDIDVRSAEHRAFMRRITDMLRRVGLSFVGVAMVADNRGGLHITRILPDPPYSFYRWHADAIHERLYTELQSVGDHVTAGSVRP